MRLANHVNAACGTNRRRLYRGSLRLFQSSAFVPGERGSHSAKRGLHEAGQKRPVPFGLGTDLCAAEGKIASIRVGPFYFV